MTTNRRQLFKDAWELARIRAKKSGRSLRDMFKLSLGVVWALVKEEAHKAALPAIPNAWEMGAKAFNSSGMFGGGMTRATRSAPVYNGW